MSVSAADIKRLIEEDEKNNPTPPRSILKGVSAGVPKASQSAAFFHLRFNQATDDAMEISDAADNLLKITNMVGVSVEAFSISELAFSLISCYYKVFL